MSIWVLRLGHRLHRDERVSTHCGLVARAFGANGITYSGDKDDSIIDSIKKVVDKWGGPFEVKYEKNWKKVVKEWSGCKVLLTMYGINLPDAIEEIRKLKNDLLIIVGSEKVRGEVYDLIDYQVAVTNQPHSEISGLSVFLDWYFGGIELSKKFNGKVRIVPMKKGKNVEKLSKEIEEAWKDIEEGRYKTASPDEFFKELVK